MKTPTAKHLTACMVLFLFLCPFPVTGAFLLSDTEMSHVNAGLVHPFAEEPVVIYVENFSHATVPADDFYWGDLNGIPGARHAGFVVGSMPETEYTFSFPNIYEGTTGYEYAPSRMPPAKEAMFPWWYDPTEVDDVALSHFPPASQRQFVNRDWGAILSWVDHTDADPLLWNGHLLVPADTVFLASALSTMDITSPLVCLTVSLVPGLPEDDTYPDLAMARDMDTHLGTLSIRDLMIRVHGGITDKNSTVESVIVVYPH